MKDKPKEGKIAFEDDCETSFPNRGPIPMEAGISAPVFKNKFLKLAATELTWRFIDHAPEDAIQDVKFN